jgi:hypothetical protein
MDKEDHKIDLLVQQYLRLIWTLILLIRNLILKKIIWWYLMEVNFLVWSLPRDCLRLVVDRVQWRIQKGIQFILQTAIHFILQPNKDFMKRKRLNKKRKRKWWKNGVLKMKKLWRFGKQDRKRKAVWKLKSKWQQLRSISW